MSTLLISIAVLVPFGFAEVSMQSWLERRVAARHFND